MHIIERSSGVWRSIGPGSYPAWSPDATSIAYGRVGPQEGTPERPIQRRDILVASADGGIPRVVVEDIGGRVTSPVAWWPSSDRILVPCR